jgi:hypothetical protein
MDTIIPKREVAAALERWLKKRRDDNFFDAQRHRVIDDLLDETRMAAVQGQLPWETDDEAIET